MLSRPATRAAHDASRDASGQPHSARRAVGVFAMCLIALAWRRHLRYRLVLATNRDEFHARPTLPLAAWQDASDIVGGRDALHGGSWLALRGRRLAAVTNVRRPPEREGHSRGALVANFVRADANTHEAFAALASDAPRYRPFNLLAHDGDALGFATNLSTIPADGEDGRDFAMRPLAPGLHGISNGALDAPWPKTETLMARLDDWLASPASADATPDLEPLFTALADTTLADDTRLPDTGIGLDRERFLSPAFIRHEAYGTRASTVVLIAYDHALIVERRFGPGGAFEGETRVVV
jgi:uncharacterized protein with NRDE domain